MRPFVFVALILIAGISHAAAGTDEIPSVSFPRFPLEIGRTHFYPASGTPAAQAELNTPFPNDFPPSLTIGLETGNEADGGGRFIILGRNYLRVYNLREVKTAPFKTIQAWLRPRSEPKIQPLWYLVVSVCRLLQSEDFTLSPTEAYWLGIVDEVPGTKLANLRKMVESLETTCESPTRPSCRDINLATFG